MSNRKTVSSVRYKLRLKKQFSIRL